VKNHHLSDCIVLDPELDSAPVVVVYGGLYGWEGAWLINKIPVDLKQSAIFVLPYHYETDCALCLKELRSKVSTDKISSYSLCGYSRGGICVYQYWKLEDWKILGLIDPSAPRMYKPPFADTVLDSVSTKIRCVYWVPNWGKDGYDGKIPDFAQHLRDLKVKMTEKATPHPDMPKFFFTTYGSDLKS
jgi:hypothetical protein